MILPDTGWPPHACGADDMVSFVACADAVENRVTGALCVRDLQLRSRKFDWQSPCSRSPHHRRCRCTRIHLHECQSYVRCSVASASRLPDVLEQPTRLQEWAATFDEPGFSRKFWLFLSVSPRLAVEYKPQLICVMVRLSSRRGASSGAASVVSINPRGDAST